MNSEKTAKTSRVDIFKYNIPCPNCGLNPPLIMWGFVQTFPEGHTKGAYWEGEEIEKCLIMCPNHNCKDGEKTATKVVDLKIPEKDRNFIFNFISDATKMEEDKIRHFFIGGYYTKCGNEPIVLMGLSRDSFARNKTAQVSF